METKTTRLKNGYELTFQRMNSKVSHIIISDHNLYPDNDSRSENYWRHNGLMIPINSDDGIKQIKKLFKSGKSIQKKQ